MQTKKQISVGLIGYPNVGKSSVINTLKSSKVCRVAPIPGETKVWQYITLTRRIYLIDCPGIVPSSANDSNTATVLKGVVRVEALPQPSEHIPALLERVKPVYIARTYGIPLPASYTPGDKCPWETEDLLEKLARMKGRLLKGGEPDLEGVAKVVLTDWVRGKLPFFVAPPERPEDASTVKEAEVILNKEGVKELKPVPQKLGGIIQKNKFEGDDIRVLDEGEELEGSVEDGSDSSENSEDSEADEDEEAGVNEDATPATAAEVGWDDVFGAVVGFDVHTESTSDGASKGQFSKRPGKVVQTEYTDDEDANPRKKQKKEARMTTSKKKSENFFTKANVKNRNRERVIPKPGREGQHPGPKGSSRKRR